MGFAQFCDGDKNIGRSPKFRVGVLRGDVMNFYRTIGCRGSSLSVLGLLSLLGLLIAATAPPAFGEAQPPPPEESVTAVEVAPDELVPDGSDLPFEELLRGPVHEGFAEQFNFEPEEGLIVDRAPPEAITEIPPDIRPEGQQVEWLPGYWFWDDERDDFLWISGAWRVVPPDVKWAPGYWAELPDGRHQWVGGTWVSSAQQQLDYIAQSPPTTLDLGPAGAAPSSNHFWVPGCWQWSSGAYAWRPGYWSIGYSDWVWVPARYRWTPRGFLFCPGYWDFPFDARGTLFCPIWFRQPVFARSAFFFTPRLALSAAALRWHLWRRPGFCHYYFGDFYGLNYRNRGFYPWFGVHSGNVLLSGGRRGYDPLFEHYSRFGRSGVTNVVNQLNLQFNQFVDQPALRPPRTFAEQVRRGDTLPPLDAKSSLAAAREMPRLAEPLRDLRDRESSRFRTVSSDQLAQFQARSEKIPERASARRTLETIRDPESSLGTKSILEAESRRGLGSRLGTESLRQTDNRMESVPNPFRERSIAPEPQRGLTLRNLTDRAGSIPDTGLRSNSRSSFPRSSDIQPGSRSLGLDRRSFSPSQLAPRQLGPREFNRGRLDPGQLRSGQFGPGQFGPSQLGPSQSRSGQLGPGQLRSGQSRSGQLGPGQLRSGQLGPGQLRSGQLGPSQLGPGQFGSGLRGTPRSGFQSAPRSGTTTQGSPRSGFAPPRSGVPGTVRPGSAFGSAGPSGSPRSGSTSSGSLRSMLNRPSGSGRSSGAPPTSTLRSGGGNRGLGSRMSGGNSGKK
jgi:hypothetical protein